MAKKTTTNEDEVKLGDTMPVLDDNPTEDKSVGEKHVYEPGVGEVRVGGKQPSDEVQFTEETPEMRKTKGKTFETTKEVTFNINGKEQKGTSFTFDSVDEAVSRRKMLVDRFGPTIIKAEEEK